jgi:hypothetical protein
VRQSGDFAAQLLRNSRKTKCGAKQLLSRFGVRPAPFALLGNSPTTKAQASLFRMTYTSNGQNTRMQEGAVFYDGR